MWPHPAGLRQPLGSRKGHVGGKGREGVLRGEGGAEHSSGPARDGGAPTRHQVGMACHLVGVVGFTLFLSFFLLLLLLLSHPRVGWSVDSAGLGLGESPLSFGYGCTGKAVVNNQYNEYGDSYGPNDVITCLLVSGWSSGHMTCQYEMCLYPL